MTLAEQISDRSDICRHFTSEANILKRVFIMQVSLVFIVLFGLTLGVPAVQATVETGWPVSQPNPPRNADDIYLNFENGIEGIAIESTISSLKFTTTNGLNWRYADIRTGSYNVDPYLNKDYEIRGNFCAWLGVTGDRGRIDFVGGGATYCSILVSTYSGVQIDAYDSKDILIATSGNAGSNVNTGTLTRLTVDAPTGQYIAYVIIHDTGNYWCMDDLCTDANKIVIPVPGRSIGRQSDRFDIVFVPDNDYGSRADIDTWLPIFLSNINNNIDQRLGAAAPVSGNLDKFNFYYTKLQGTASSKTLPADLTKASPFADAYVIFHTAVFGDSTIMSKPSIYGAEGTVGRSFIHESGHGIFGVADEYDGCGTYYFKPSPNPNIWHTEAECRADATAAGWNPDDCSNFTACQGGWWKVGTTKYIMWDGTQFANGWGKPAARRIQWVLDQYSSATAANSATAAVSPQAGKSIWLNLTASAEGFNLINDCYLTDSPPSYLPGTYDFTAKVYSTSGDLLGEYGFDNPRRIMAESDYVGPTMLDTANFQLILPYFNNGGRVDLIESASGSVKLSVDISKYATPDNYAPLANFSATPTTGGAPLTVIFTDSSLNSPSSWNWDFGDGNYSIEKDPSYIYLVNGTYTVSLTATNAAGSNTKTVDNYITVNASSGVDNVGVFRNGSFYLKDATAFGYGLTGDFPIAGDWTGSGVDNGGVFRNGSFYLKDGPSFAYGLTGDKPVAGNWTGDRTAEVGVFRDGVFYLRDSTGGTYSAFAYGLTGDKPIAGDWDGNGATEVGVFRDGVFYLRDSTGGTYSAFAYGLTSDKPIAGKWMGSATEARSPVGKTRDVTFNKAGAYDYTTVFQPETSGVITVTA